jgi:NMD protein affecting ribosome stability and mRNA decay
MQKEEFLKKLDNPTEEQIKRIDKIFIKKTVTVEDITIITSWSRYIATKIVKKIKNDNPSNIGLSKTTITLSQFLNVYETL